MDKVDITILRYRLKTFSTYFFTLLVIMGLAAYAYLNVDLETGNIINGKVMEVTVSGSSKYEPPYPIARVLLEGGEYISIGLPREQIIKPGDSISLKERISNISGVTSYVFNKKENK